MRYVKKTIGSNSRRDIKMIELMFAVVCAIFTLKCIEATLREKDEDVPAWFTFGAIIIGGFFGALSIFLFKTYFQA